MDSSASYPPLLQALAQLEDKRARRGVRYSLASLLALACSAMLCGYSSYEAMAQWGRDYGQALSQALGFTRGRTPCAATFFYAFKHVDHHELERLLSAWAQQVLSTFPPAMGEWEAIDLDGKTLRGSAKMGAPGAHLLSAFSQRLGVTLGQKAVSNKTNEITAAPHLLESLVLTGRVVTMDALLTQRPIAEVIVAKGGTI